VGTYRYQITVGGGLGQAGREAFEGFGIEPDGQGTMLLADMDQAALFGALFRIQSLGLELVKLTRLADDSGGLPPVRDPVT
jgi:hypothetical protein